MPIVEVAEVIDTANIIIAACVIVALRDQLGV
jgi:hypothetical protein